jgi:hypothetical protein
MVALVNGMNLFGNGIMSSSISNQTLVRRVNNMRGACWRVLSTAVIRIFALAYSLTEREFMATLESALGGTLFAEDSYQYLLEDNGLTCFG